MRQLLVLGAAAVFGAGFLLAACDDTGPAPLSGSDSGTDAAPGKDAAGDSTVDAEPGDAGGDGGADADPDADPDAGDDGGDAATGDAGDSGPAPTCDPTRGWNTGVKITSSTLGVDALEAVTGSESVLAWITPSDGVIHYVGRDFPQDPWGAEQTLPGSGLASGQKVALSSDGLYLYALAASKRSIQVFTRSSRADPFTGPGTATAADLNTEGSALTGGANFSDLVIGTSSTALILRIEGGSSPGLRLSTRVLPTDTWATTTAFAPQSEFDVVAGKARRPTGLSTDRRALFYFDEVTAHQKVAYFDYDATLATQFTDMGVIGGAQPNEDCTVLYYDATADLYSATQK